MNAGASLSNGGWPPAPGTPPEVPPPWTPERRTPPFPPGRPPVYPPVPVVYEDAPARDDLADRLLEQRIVMVSGPLDLARSTEAAARLMLLDGSGDEPIQLVMSCPDGELVAATALADTIELVGVELRTVCSGSVGGPTVLPFALGTCRFAHPHSRFRLVEPMLELEGRASDLAEATAQQASQLAELHRRMAAATGQTIATIAADFRGGRLLTPTEAQAYGLVDEIIHRHGLRTV